MASRDISGYESTAPSGSRLGTETKQAFKTTEFWIYVVVLLGLFLAGAITGGDDGGTAASGATGGPTGGDDLDAGRVWLYAIILTVGYLLSRGTAKAGSRDSHWDTPGEGAASSIGERVRTAAQVLTDGPEAVRGSSGPGSEPTTRL